MLNVNSACSGKCYVTRDRTKPLDPDGVDIAGRPLRHCETNRPETVIKGMSKWSLKIFIVKIS